MPDSKQSDILACLKDIEQSINEIYESVSEDVIWLIVNRYLPVLEKEVKNLLR